MLAAIQNSFIKVVACTSKASRTVLGWVREGYVQVEGFMKRNAKRISVGMVSVMTPFMFASSFTTTGFCLTAFGIATFLIALIHVIKWTMKGQAWDWKALAADVVGAWISTGLNILAAYLGVFGWMWMLVELSEVLVMTLVV